MWTCDTLPLDNTRADIERFLALLNTQVHDFFSPAIPLTVGRAPGRLDLMGGIADYSGSLVLQMPLAVATIVALQSISEPTLVVCSTTASEIAGDTIVQLPLDQLHQQGQPISYKEAHTLFNQHDTTSWAAYVLGIIVSLQFEQYLTLKHGLRILVHCEVPIGKGVSSSAALEVATMQALCAHFKLSLNGHDIARLCQKVENVIVGAPCGIMDQMASTYGENNSLLALLCQPAVLLDAVPLPEGIEIWGIDSGVRHAVSGADYGSVRVGAFMGYRMIAEMAGLTAILHEPESITIDDPYWQGYLANIPPSLWETMYREKIPVTMRGDEFLQRYSGTTDPVTHIDPGLVYAIRQPTAHPIYEHHRVQLFRALLQLPQPGEAEYTLLGELMYQSHASYSACQLGSNGTNMLVELVRQQGPQAGLYGAKITGGGSGGTVAILARNGSEPHLQQIIKQYEQETGLTTTILHGTSSGAKAWGYLQFHST
ncbi:MAG TPA: galactokinase family protein [Dictyobacter sp.]|jgi:L-arabinokinase|nr:galactokinase family protein [Dictyobacter sp.]